MPKLQYRITAKFGEWTTIADPELGDGAVMLTSRPRGFYKPGEAILSLGPEPWVVRVDWETLVRWGCAEACEPSEVDLEAGDEPPLQGYLMEIGDSEEHEATPETGYAVAIVRMPIADARELGPRIRTPIHIMRGAG